MTLALRPYQQDLLDRVRAAFAQHRTVCMQLPTGGGKTRIMAEILRRCVARPPQRALFLAHLDALLDDTAARLRADGVPVGIIQGGRAADPTAPVQVASLQTLHRRTERPPADLVILDECFPAGVLVDGRPIETIRVGDVVSSLNHATNRIEQRRVTRIVQRLARTLVRVHLRSAGVVDCTPNHPFFTGGHYVNAENLQEGDPVLVVRGGFVPPPTVVGTELLLSGVRSSCACGELEEARLHARSTGEALGGHAHQQSKQAQRCASEGFGEPEANWTPPARPWRQRHREYPPPADASRCARVANGSGRCDAHAPIGRVAAPLQDRHCQRALESGDRSRREQPLRTCSQSSGPAQRGILAVARVDRVEVLEPAGHLRYGGVPVFNLEVHGNRNFFANGILVHNCHRAVAPSVRAVLEAYPDAVLLGGTATPQRGDARPLGDVFESLVAGPSMRDLIAQGHLVPIDVFAPGKHYENRLSADPVAAYTEHAAGKRAIVFAANSEHARQLAAAYAAAGYPSAVVLGTTGRQRRHDARAALEAGDIRVLVGCGVFIEGWDCPAVEVVVLARAFGVTGGYLQAIGRGTRPSPATGKERCTVIDLRGAVHMHGLPDEDRIWSLTGAAVRRTETLPALARCRECLAIARPCRTCPRCGAAMQGAPKVPRVLTRGERLEKWSAVPAAIRDARYVARLVTVATQRMRMTPPSAERWAVARFRKQFGREPEVMRG